MKIFITRSAERDLLDGYAIYYLFNDELVTVLAVLDCRRNPMIIRKTLQERGQRVAITFRQHKPRLQSSTRQSDT